MMCIPAHYHHQKIFCLVFFLCLWSKSSLRFLSWKIALGPSNEQADARLDSE